MINFDNTHIGKGIAGIIHLFAGLLKADGAISSAEREKIKYLFYKFHGKLPGDYEIYGNTFNQISEDPDYTNWDHEMHMEKGFALFDAYLSEGVKHDDHLEAILEMLELLSDVDEVNDLEEVYIGKVRSHFVNVHGLSA